MSYFATNYSKLSFPLAEAGGSGLRPAQVAAAHAVSGHFFNRSEPAIVVMPTGSGKTGVMMLVAFLLRAKRVLVVTPSRMVCDQLADGFGSLMLLRRAGALGSDIELPRIQNVRTRISTAERWAELLHKDVVVTTTQSASPHLADVAQPDPDLFDLVVIDEAHHAPALSWSGLIAAFPNARHALFTATPFRRDEKPLRGRVVFDYPLARARDDGIFGQLRYQPVLVGDGDDPDRVLASAADSIVRRARLAGSKTLVLVRTAQRTRAGELARLYRESTSLKLALVDSGKSQKYARTVVEKMRAGELDGAICVDMLGEGFDLPDLKVAVLHSPHKSLGVTLQFIGRFARTNSSTSEIATFLAVPNEIEGEAAQLYRPGAEWNEIVEESSRKRIDREREARELLETFTDAGARVLPFTDPDSTLSLDDLAPRFHVKIYEMRTGVDLNALRVPEAGEVIMLQKSDVHDALVCVARQVSRYRWCRNPALASVRHSLFVLFYHSESGLLFVAASDHDRTLYDTIVQSVAMSTGRMLAPNQLKRILRGVAESVFFSVGMRRRAGRDESYRILSGGAADRTLQFSDARFFDHGHCYGTGKEGGGQVMLGFSTSSKVWSNGGGLLHEFIDWCQALASKLIDPTPVSTGSGIDFLPLSTRVDAFPSHIISADWNDKWYTRGWSLGAFDQHGVWSEAAIHEFDLPLLTQTSNDIAFRVAGANFELDVAYKISAEGYEFSTGSTFQNATITTDDDTKIALAAALQEWPPIFFTTSLARLEGDLLSGAAPPSTFDISKIEPIGWAVEKVNPRLEKPNGQDRSIFEWLEARLKTETSLRVIYNDDDAGEVADFVTLADAGHSTTHVHLYHCKATKGTPVPGKRIEDLYDVVGQAIKCTRLAETSLLREHLAGRSQQVQKNRFIRGCVQDLEDLLSPKVQVQFHIVIVQPGVGLEMSDDQNALLGAASVYVIGGSVVSFRLVGGR